MTPLRAALRSLLGGGLLYCALFVLVHAVLGFVTTGVTVSTVICLILVSAPQLGLVRRRSLDLPAPQAAAIALAATAAAVIGLWSMAASDRGTYVAWFLGAITLDLLGLTIVGRFRVAWLTMLAVTVAAVVWAVTHGMGVGDGLLLVVRHAATLLVGTLIAISLRRSGAAFEAFQALRVRRTTEEEVARARIAARRDAAAQVLDEAGPTLRAIAEGRATSAQDRAAMLALEGALRDQIRTPLLVQGPLRDSLAAARRRGIDVLIMDQAEDAPGALRSRATLWLAERLDGIVEGTFTGRIRATPEGVRVTAVAGDGGDSRSFGDEQRD